MSNEIEEIRQELARLNHDFQQRISALEARIEQLAPTNEAEEVPATSTIKPPAIEPEDHQQLTEEAPFTEPPQKPSVDQPVPEQEQQPNKPRFGWGLLLPILGPFAALIEKGLETYRHYQTQGKAPAFLMTVAGIIALILGFGYLLQLSFTEYLSETGKVVIGFIGAIAISAVGIVVVKRQQTMADYGASLIALGVVIQYLCIYFAGPYYQLIGYGFSIVLLGIITAIAYGLALFFETRVVAVVTLVGGAFSPLWMAQNSDSAPIYFGYLLLINSMTLLLAWRIRWHVLAYLALIVVVACFEYQFSHYRSANYSALWLTLVIHAYCYSFAFYLRSIAGTAHEQGKQLLWIVGGNLIFLVTALYQIVPSFWVLGIVYTLNGVLWLAIGVIPTTFLTRGRLFVEETILNVRLVAFAYSGLLCGVAALAFFKGELLGLVWGMEAIMFLFLGLHFKSRAIRSEGYLILLIASGTMALEAIQWLASSFTDYPILIAFNASMGLWNLVAIGLLAFAAVKLLDRFDNEIHPTERRVQHIIENTYCVSLALIILAFANLIWPGLLWLMSLPAAFIVLEQAKKRSLQWSEVFGLLLPALLVVPIIASGIHAGNFHFTQQSLLAKIARIELFMSLWLIPAYYSRFNYNSQLYSFILRMRTLFFILVPIVLLPTIARRAPEYFPLAIWVSTGISLYLYQKLGLKALRSEALLLSIVSILITLSACFMQYIGKWQGYGYAALVAGLVYYGFVLWYWQGMQRKPAGEKSEQWYASRQGIKVLFPTAFYYFGLALGVITYGTSGLLHFGVFMIALYFVALYWYQPTLVPVRNQLLPFYLIFHTLAIVLLGLYFFEIIERGDQAHGLYPLQVALLMIALGWLVHAKRPQSRHIWRRYGKQNLHISVFHGLLFTSYCLIFIACFPSLATVLISIALVAHATGVLFQTLRDQYQKLLPLAGVLFGIAAIKIVFFDMAEFSLTEKIIALMIIGALLLLAAYQYQKQRNPALKPERL